MNEQENPDASNETEEIEETQEPQEPGKPRGKYDREAKLKELLEQDEKTSPWADPFMGF